MSGLYLFGRVAIADFAAAEIVAARDRLDIGRGLAGRCGSMVERIESILMEVTGARQVSVPETLQRLWSGYGSIARYALDGAGRDSVIVKHIRHRAQQGIRAAGIPIIRIGASCAPTQWRRTGISTMRRSVGLAAGCRSAWGLSVVGRRRCWFWRIWMRPGIHGARAR